MKTEAEIRDFLKTIYDDVGAIPKLTDGRVSRDYIEGVKNTLLWFLDDKK
jgi:hypothetical protein